MLNGCKEIANENNIQFVTPFRKTLIYLKGGVTHRSFADWFTSQVTAASGPEPGQHPKTGMQTISPKWVVGAYAPFP